MGTAMVHVRIDRKTKVLVLFFHSFQPRFADLPGLQSCGFSGCIAPTKFPSVSLK
jgi:hypothetical protein